MLRSKSHHPWQPRVSDGQILNPSAHTAESDTNFSDAIEQVESDGPASAEPREPVAAASSGNAAEDFESLSAAPETPRGKSRWYASLVHRFTGTRH